MPLPPMEVVMSFRTEEGDAREADTLVDQAQAVRGVKRPTRGDVLREIFRLGLVAYRASLAAEPTQNRAVAE